MTKQLNFDDDDDRIALEASWSRVLRRLQPDVPSAWFDRFIRPLKPLSAKDGVISIGVPGKFVLEWVRDKYLATLQSMLSDEFGVPVAVELRTEPRIKSPEPMDGSRSVVLTSHAAKPDRFRPNAKYSFPNFVVGQSNRYAVAGAQAVAKELGSKYNPLFIYGPSGLGKTHLLNAIAMAVAERDPRLSVMYITAQQFAEDFVNAIQANQVDKFRKAQRAVELWLVDDVQFVAGKDKTQEEFFHTFNTLQGFGKQIVITADRAPRMLNLVDERLRSRFEAGLVADVQMPDTETRCAIVMSKAKQERIDIPAPAAFYLAEHVPGNIRILEGALIQCAARASVDQVPIDIDLASRVVEELLGAGTLAKPGFEQIVEAVAKVFRIPSDDIKGISRKAPIVHARHVAIYLMREVTGDSWQHIGSLFGNRDHTSMMHAYRKIEDLSHRDHDLRSCIHSLKRNLYPESTH